jgi:hypothetical protein
VPLRSSVFVTLLALVASTSTAASTTTSPGLVHRGSNTTIALGALPGYGLCHLAVRYANGAVQDEGHRGVVNHRATWVVKVPSKAALGVASWTADCGSTLHKGSFVVVDTVSKTKPTAPRVVVTKQGFSQRPDANDPGSAVSYGLILRNTSTSEDAQNVYLIVNLVDAAGQLLGTKTGTIPLVQAGASFALGDSIALRTQVGVVRLELTIRVGAHQPRSRTPMPDFANVRILPSTGDPGWVAEVDGEIVNDTSKQTLQSSMLSVVLLNAAGNPIGGGTGATFAPLPSGSRIVFLVQSGFSAVPLDKAVTAVVSAEPTYVAG